MRVLTLAGALLLAAACVPHGPPAADAPPASDAPTADAINPQTLEPGSWTGMLSWCCARPATPGVEAIAHHFDASYDVAVRDDTIAIAGHFTEPHTGESFSIPLSRVEKLGDTLTFRFQMGERADCMLIRRGDGAFEGSCKTANAGKEDGIRILMVPPKAE